MSSCKKCGEVSADRYLKWCKPCQMDNLKENFTNWTSGNEKIDNLIQEMQLKIDDVYDKVFEWIPYDQFSDIKEIGRGEVNTVYSAIWEDGPLEYDYDCKEYTRISSNRKVALKYLHNSQNINDEFLNEVYMKVL